ncbi:hypothetical protein ONZ51_g9397 [Trametes cubensis]|uniref:Uncharacterized protein n=1 Tax=Trametes cubensis TaxID=1111947 RepID=A0AAD7TNA3_9APHY|nr:hypothetical protein ONZ51_g9397 [Trametes cubensis]
MPKTLVRVLHEDPTLRCECIDASEHARRALHKSYSDACPLCMSYPEYFPSQSATTLNTVQLIENTPQGIAQLTWLRSSGIDCGLTIDSTQNMLPLCGCHRDPLARGIMVLCPPLEDLRAMIAYEEEDWKKRLEASKNVDGSPQSKPLRERSAPSPSALSGYLSCFWLGHALEGLWPHLGNTDFDASELPIHQTPVSVPQQVLLSQRRGDGHLPMDFPSSHATQPPIFELRLQFNRPDLCRINPYAVMVRAMEVFNGPFTPPDYFFREKLASETVVHYARNKIPEYEASLLRLRQLYSRTAEDLARESGAPSLSSNQITWLDRIRTTEESKACEPGVEEVPDESSKRYSYYEALGTEPWLQYDPEDDELPEEMIEEAKRQLGSGCLLCGQKENVVVHRVAIPHGVDFDPRPWLHSLQLIPDVEQGVDTTLRSNISNLILLCPAHADAYDYRAWRLMPSAKVREAMLASRPPETLNIINSSFDLLIFMPHKMPLIDLLDSSKGGQVVPKEAFEGVSCIRVIESFRNLSLNPYMVYGWALHMIGSVYLPTPDDKLRSIEDECLRIRNAWNESLRGKDALPVFLSDFFYLNGRKVEYYEECNTHLHAV